MAESNGVTHYDKATATVTVWFANGIRTCQRCEYLYNERGLNRCKCELQHGKIIPSDCIDSGRDMTCPLRFDDETEVK